MKAEYKYAKKLSEVVNEAMKETEGMDTLWVDRFILLRDEIKRWREWEEKLIKWENEKKQEKQKPFNPDGSIWCTRNSSERSDNFENAERKL